MTIVTEDPNVLTPQTLNNFLVCNRDVVRQARVHVIHHHSRRIKALTRPTKTAAAAKQEGSEEQGEDDNSGTKHSHLEKNKNKKKALRMSQEIKAVKNLSDGDLIKLVLLNNKSFDKASRDGSSPGFRAVCRVAEHPAVAKCKAAFKTQFKESISKLPFCIKVLGIQRRYKKIRKVGKEGKKQKFLDTERVCFRLLQEIGGSEFVAAEDLYKKIRNKKLREKEAAKAKASGDGAAPDGEPSKGSDQEGGTSSEEEEDSEQRQLRDKIFKKLDSQFGKWDDDQLSDEDKVDSDNSEDADQGLTAVAVAKSAAAAKLPIAAPAKKDCEKTTSSQKRKSANTEVVTKKSIKLTQKTQSCDNQTDAPPSKETTSSKFFTASKGTVKELDLKMESDDTVKVDEIAKPAPLPFPATDKIKPIDLNKIGRNAVVIPLVSKKSTAELLSVDDRMPKKLAYKKARQQRAQSELDSKRSSSGPSFFAGRNDYRDEADDEEVRSKTGQDDAGWGMDWGDTGRGRGRGVAGRGRGDTGRGRGRGETSWGMDRGDAGRGRGRGDTGRGRGRGRNDSGCGETERGRGRGSAGRGKGRSDTAAEASRGESGRDLPHSSRGSFTPGGVGDATDCGPNRGSLSRGGFTATSNGPRGGSRGGGSSAALHPSWEAKKKQKCGITTFLGKKIVFD